MESILKCMKHVQGEMSRIFREGHSLVALLKLSTGYHSLADHLSKINILD